MPSDAPSDGMLMMQSEREAEAGYLGQFIPLQYHHNMLMDRGRMQSFKTAIDHVVFPGARVLELGGGTGVLSWFAAAKAANVWCVEFNPELAGAARKFLSKNEKGEKVQVIEADAFQYMPPEPVDVVICEMIHAAMLREKQIAVMESFKERYLKKFGGPLPVLIPTAVVLAVQPVQQDYHFEGYFAPIVQVLDASHNDVGTIEIAPPTAYCVLDFTRPMPEGITYQGECTARESGTVNALRFITKNILSMSLENGTSVDWMSMNMTVPLAEPVSVRAGESLQVRFHYAFGGLIASLENTISVQNQE